jgi:hypothetical protein
MPTSPADRSALRGLTSLFLGLFSIPSLGYGVYLAWCWVRVHTSDIYYADYGYARAALAFLGLGLIGLWATFYGVWRRSFYGVLLVVPILIGITVMVDIPNVLPRGYSCMADSNYFSDVNAFLRVWYEPTIGSRRTFPNSGTQWHKVLPRGNTVSVRLQRASTSNVQLLCHIKWWLWPARTALGWQISHSVPV